VFHPNHENNTQTPILTSIDKLRILLVESQLIDSNHFCSVDFSSSATPARRNERLGEQIKLSRRLEAAAQSRLMRRVWSHQ
jgi:hypothetical protein